MAIQAGFDSWQSWSAIFTEAGVASILPFIRKTGTAFDDHATKVIGEAFDAACAVLHDSGQPQIVYDVIAKRIIDAAKRGERDIVRLRDAGLAAPVFAMRASRYSRFASVEDRIRIIKREAVPECGSFQVRFPDDRPSQYFYWDDIPAHRMRPETLDRETALEKAKAVASVAQIK
jgi:hypothetical protein